MGTKDGPEPGQQLQGLVIPGPSQLAALPVSLQLCAKKLPYLLFQSS